jgi:hypothetical protein
VTAHTTPDYCVKAAVHAGPRCERQCPGCEWHDKGVPSETAPLEKLSAFMVRLDADVDLCYPGNHGGPDDAWLVTVTRQGANDIRESFGKTLDEAINKAVEAAEDG